MIVNNNDNCKLNIARDMQIALREITFLYIPIKSDSCYLLWQGRRKKWNDEGFL